ncbi:hypothetical protein BC835DRAFT_258009 [Cytidiella melzeri]|nr:hypothetical protein BC835DRAFT_258009 [Cytidiella melzeri]
MNLRNCRRGDTDLVSCTPLSIQNQSLRVKAQSKRECDLNVARVSELELCMRRRTSSAHGSFGLVTASEHCIHHHPSAWPGGSIRWQFTSEIIFTRQDKGEDKSETGTGLCTRCVQRITACAPR